MGLCLGADAIHDFISVQWTLPLSFRTRDWLGKSPPVSEKLKIYAFDDKTMASMGTDDLPLADWELMVERMAEQLPQAVLIDKMFGTPRGRPRPGFAQRLRETKVPVVSGAFVTPNAIPGRAALNLDGDASEIRSRFGVERPGSLRNAAWIPSRGAFVYGPPPMLHGAFSSFGHVMYDGSGTIEPLLRIDDEHVVQHLALSAASRLRLRAHALETAGGRVPIDGAGRLIVNFAAPDSLRDRTASLRPLLQGMRAGLSFSSVIEKGSLILVAPGMFTGATDFVSTPLGVMPGSYVIASVVNSLLTGAWVRPLGPTHLDIFLAVIAGSAVGFALGGPPFWIILGLLEAAAVLGSIALFSLYGWLLPWVELALAIGVSGLAQNFVRSTFKERQTIRLYQALGSIVSRNRLEHLVRSPEKITLEPTGRVVSIMFVDIVGFSAVVEKQHPRQAFISLKQILNSLTEAIHEHGGVVDKTLGDGVLAYFGYDLTGAAINDHADQALKCALRLQKESLARALQLNGGSGPYPYPLRVGINSGAAFIGDLGDTKRIDITLIGQAVNFAQRLESACNDYCVQISASTRSMLATAEDMGVKIYRQHIQIKHHEELVETYEVDPFHDKAESRATAIKNVQTYLGKFRKEERVTMPADLRLRLVFSLGEGIVRDISPSGLAVSTIQDIYIGKGSELLGRLECSRPDLQQIFDTERLSTVVCICKWSRAHGAKFEHGFVLKNLVSEQGAKLYLLLSEAAGAGYPESRDACGQ